jgi:synaptic vesicle membrane protein VAT-1
MMMNAKERTQPAARVFGHDASLLVAVSANVLSWLVRTFLPSAFLARLLPRCEQEEEAEGNDDEEGTDEEPIFDRASARRRLAATRCVSIGRPGGVEQLRWVRLKPGICTVGYNVPNQDTPFTSPLRERTSRDDETSGSVAAAASPTRGAASATTSSSSSCIPNDCVVLDNRAFSVNYADCCIRWGLYESANRFVGYPIVPGFDVAGIVTHVGRSVQNLIKVGDRAFGCTLFGGYSTRVLVPAAQLRRVPDSMTLAQAASLPAVSITAIYALYLAGHYNLPSHARRNESDKSSQAPDAPPSGMLPLPPPTFGNRSILIHSAAGGVGSMLVQMAKILGLHPIVGVVGRPDKVDAAHALGCHVVVDKSSSSAPDWWKVVRDAAPHGYSAIMDPNGVDTLRQSYHHLAMMGRLVVFGFHTNLPLGRDMLNPWEWIKMAFKMRNMPTLDVMDLVQSNKSVLGFNLSFLATEREALAALFDQVLEWLSSGLLECPRIVEMDMPRVAEAHQHIQSGRSVGKIVLTAASTLPA